MIYIKAVSWMYLLHELNISECYRTQGVGPDQRERELAVVLVDLFNCFSVLHFSKTRILALLAEEPRE